MVKLSRREFIGLAGATGALGTGCNSPGTRSQAGPLLSIPHQRGDLAAFDHIVVLMMENRSFDQLLGYLYGSCFRYALYGFIPAVQTHSD